MKYKPGQTRSLKDGYRLEIQRVDEDNDSIDAVVYFPRDMYPNSELDYTEYDDVPATTVDAIIAHHNRKLKK